jgi:DtxR family Mn-dependent transcriptional regulator
VNDTATAAWIWLGVAALAALFVLLPRLGLLARLRGLKEKRLRTRFEDALKHILAWQERGKSASPESLTGALSMSPRRTLDILTKMEAGGLVRSVADGVRLTPKGERLGLQVVRAHRLWERYLADDAGVPMERLHQAAEKAEHGLTPGRLDELEAHLGHPQTDPHGDPIPARDGSMSSLDAVSLNEWPSDELARIVHIEDEPAVIFRQILAANLRPGVTVRILEDTLNQLVIRADGREHSLPHAVAANIQVAAEQRPTDRLEGARRLSALREGQSARVVEIDDACRGFSRRRLMDLGLTPDTRVEVALENTFGDPRAFRIRGTTIALRSEQADHVWVRPVESEDQEAA